MTGSSHISFCILVHVFNYHHHGRDFPFHWASLLVWSVLYVSMVLHSYLLSIPFSALEVFNGVLVEFG